MMDKKENCYIINNIVTNICERSANANCMPADMKEVPAQHRVISGSFTITNVIMANWSTQMWQNILNKVMRFSIV
ncbi:hypothetical protein DICVIV_09029 [Dictyocaulus viviparus]|uniref:Uncharacterized protein n=1 Tax=Dictyocaulus viviparus TaxID=29172 RepID=A0A0D8XK35_DICVI|nr:hypothetical protein DICVIV_09029 [Dictyocaulus viviparus]